MTVHMNFIRWFHIKCSASHQTAGDELDVCGSKFPPQGYFISHSLIRVHTVVLIKPQLLPQTTESNICVRRNA